MRRVHQPHQAVDEVVDVAEGAGLTAVTVDRDRFAAKGLHHEGGHDPAVVDVGARPVGVEYPCNLDRHVMLAPIVEEQRLRTALAFVVAGARPDRVDVAGVVLDLRMDVGVAVHLAGRRLEDGRPHPLRKPQHVDGAVHADLGGLHGVEPVVDRGGRTGEVVDLVDLDVERERDVVPDGFEAGVRQCRGDVVPRSREVVVDAQDLVAAREQAFTEMGAEEPRPAGHQYPLSAFHRRIPMTL